MRHHKKKSQEITLFVAKKYKKIYVSETILLRSDLVISYLILFFFVNYISWRAVSFVITLIFYFIFLFVNTKVCEFTLLHFLLKWKYILCKHSNVDDNNDDNIDDKSTSSFKKMGPYVCVPSEDHRRKSILLIFFCYIQIYRNVSE